MLKVDLRQNFSQIYRTLSEEKIKPTNLAKSLGYTTTSQLNSVLDGTSMLSTKAICAMIENLNVNPSYLFLGQGEMFIDESGEDELTKLRNENVRLTREHRKAVDAVMTLGSNIHELEQMYSKLAEVHAESLKYYKGKDKPDEDKSVETEELQSK